MTTNRKLRSERDLWRAEWQSVTDTAAVLHEENRKLKAAMQRGWSWGMWEWAHGPTGEIARPL